MTNRKRQTHVSVTICGLFTALTVSTAFASTTAATAASLTIDQIKNLKVLVPSMGEGPGDWIQFRKGNGLKNKTVGWAKMTSVAVGTDGKKPFAVSHITWQGVSGSGIWNTLILFKESNGKIKQTGRYTPMVSTADKVDIRRGRVFVHLTDPEEVTYAKEHGGRAEGKGWMSIPTSMFDQ